MARKKSPNIVRGWAKGTDEIKYYMMDGSKLPEITKVFIDGTKLRVELATGETRPLPDLNKGYLLHQQTKYSLTFKKAV